MALSLNKGGNLSLTKTDPNLTKLLIGLGWDERATSGAEFDLDASVFLLNTAGKVRGDHDFIFYNQLKSDNGAIEHTGDNRTGAGDVDDEQIVVKLDSMPAQYESIIFVVAIYEGKTKKQSFGKVQNAFIRAVDARGKEICRFNVSGSASFDRFCSMTFAEVTREGTGWNFRAIGNPHETDRFVDLLRPYC